MPNIIKIQQCFLELRLKMSGMIFLRHTVFCVYFRPWTLTAGIWSRKSCCKFPRLGDTVWWKRHNHRSG